MTFRKFFSFQAAAGAVIVLVGASAGNATASGDATCTGGSVAAGAYSSLNIAGVCNVDKGSVTVQHNLTVLPGATLIAVFAGSNVTVGGNLEVQSNATLVLGCEPFAFICANDPNQVTGTLTTKDTVSGNLTAENAYEVVVHSTAISHNVSMSGGGGGVNCAAFQYGDFEDNTIGGNLTIAEWQSCWLGAFRNTVVHNVDIHNNVTADPDGNEFATNTIGGNMNCAGNNPTPQIGDSGGKLNTVAGRANGQCAALAP